MARTWLQTIDFTKRILEIGPQSTPMVKKTAERQVFYADIRATEDVKNFYKNDPTISVSDIVDIDYVLGNETYSACFQGVEKFDYILASHVLEHIPQLIAFFQDIPNILNSRGKLCLAIPDKRFCYDHFRCPTSFAECYDIYTRSVQNSPMRVLDHLLNKTVNDSIYWFKNSDNFDQLASNQDRFNSAKEHYLRFLDCTYLDLDAHVSVFTPETFLIFLYHMLNSDLLSFACAEFYHTDRTSNEFNCVLEFNPGLLTNGIERQKENKNLIRLLNENSDQKLQCPNLQEKLLNEELAKVNDELLKQNTALKAMLNSRSWRITKPLRKSGEWLRSLLSSR